jgi:enterochelin esterase-like enzyme
LIPYVDLNYRTIQNRAARALAGYSMGAMGAYGALRYALVYPVFGAPS